MVSVPEVMELEAFTVSHAALLDAAQVVLAPPALILTDCEGGTMPVSALNTRLDGVTGSSATWL